ncbi:DNA replication protein dnaD [Companilactobacillus paralimentarius DSM 13238 = JCM 10415]|uniref:DNA replication protein dnaD n=1 Tax=Companilactobacillus paralimentarius DSM 13238 = JCM 10415 TaxID=1122151 RepID=A0A0R1PEN8_9LACO|nr:DnaD domain protein [Companilactobacillus paralimentarius]KAE9564658.1 DNA replication protein DnaD [Companilactobacillus paralimentarius]KRL30909.1 DNA replication protein dnaD [Companilactobacillus paralimentarius DSM 13238 = JCM 10415]MDR4934011.1 DnaD domain protein [Companilactobacillus paralimentarius]QFR70406.1 DnaD domain protein [Companilactobacillus paralimentarius]
MEDELFNEFVESGSTSINNLILQNYHNLGMTEKDLIVYLALSMYAQKGVTFPMAKDLAKNTGMDEASIYTIIQGLIKLGVIELKTIMDHHQQRDIYSLTPIYHRIKSLLQQEQESNQQNRLMSETEELFRKIEVEFGRPLSPIEQEQIHQWIDDDHYSVELIDLALREAVLNQAYSLKYMDRILISWEKSNIKTAEQLQDRRKKLGY